MSIIVEFNVELVLFRVFGVFEYFFNRGIDGYYFDRVRVCFIKYGMKVVDFFSFG